MSRRGLAVLGATGSVGRSTLDVARRHKDKLAVQVLTAGRDAEALARLCLEFRPRLAVIGEVEALPRLRALLDGSGIAVEAGADALAAAAAGADAECVMSAIVGAAGLLPTLAAIRAGRRVLVANKEPLVMAGALMMREARVSGATLIPIDSEHNAVFQCLSGDFRCGGPDSLTARGVRRIVLTASGGPFRDTPLAELAAVTPAQAVRHPNWVMGPKISVDSATMMNKGLELIEAQRLFDVPGAQLDVVLHPESVIHALVEYQDGSTLAQLGQPDMRVPIAHALAWPERWESGVEGLDLPALSRMNFAELDDRRYPCLGLARAALDDGGSLPNVVNAANEIAVENFLAGAIGYTAIPETIEHVMTRSAQAGLPRGDTLEDVLAVDAWARAEAQRHCATREVRLHA